MGLLMKMIADYDFSDTSCPTNEEILAFMNKCQEEEEEEDLRRKVYSQGSSPKEQIRYFKLVDDRIAKEKGISPEEEEKDMAFTGTDWSEVKQKAMKKNRYRIKWWAFWWWIEIVILCVVDRQGVREIFARIAEINRSRDYDFLENYKSPIDIGMFERGLQEVNEQINKVKGLLGKVKVRRKTGFGLPEVSSCPTPPICKPPRAAPKPVSFRVKFASEIIEKHALVATRPGVRHYSGTIMETPIKPRSVGIEILPLDLKVSDDGEGNLIGNEYPAGTTRAGRQRIWGSVQYEQPGLLKSKKVLSTAQWEITLSDDPEGIYPIILRYETIGSKELRDFEQAMRSFQKTEAEEQEFEELLSEILRGPETDVTYRIKEFLEKKFTKKNNQPRFEVHVDVIGKTYSNKFQYSGSIGHKLIKPNSVVVSIPELNLSAYDIGAGKLVGENIWGIVEYEKKGDLELKWEIYLTEDPGVFKEGELPPSYPIIFKCKTISSDSPDDLKKLFNSTDDLQKILAAITQQEVSNKEVHRPSPELMADLQGPVSISEGYLRPKKKNKGKGWRTYSLFGSRKKKKEDEVTYADLLDDGEALDGWEDLLEEPLEQDKPTKTFTLYNGKLQSVAYSSPPEMGTVLFLETEKRLVVWDGKTWIEVALDNTGAVMQRPKPVMEGSLDVQKSYGHSHNVSQKPKPIIEQPTTQPTQEMEKSEE